MLSLRFIRENPDQVREAIRLKGEAVELDRLIELDARVRALTVEADQLKARRNEASHQIASLKAEGENPGDLIEEMRGISTKIKALDEEIRELQSDLDALLLTVPNLPSSSVPEGADGSENVEVRAWGDRPTFDFVPRPHWELTQLLGLVDFERASKVAGAFFVTFTGTGARLVRALINFMLDLHTAEHGYMEMWPPTLVNRDCMTGTGQLPKLEEDMYYLQDDGFFLIPTAEVPLTGHRRDELLAEDELPIRYAAYTPCFRREAGSYGAETRGLIRVHQFDKVELVRIVPPDRSEEQLESLVREAEVVLQRLELPYRVMFLCSGELSFAACMCYDLEVWSPGQERYLEVSSCSHFGEFQARRLSIRFRPADGGRPRYPHTLNGSGVALPRTIIGLLENHQQADGSVRIPAALRDYLGGQAVLTPP